MLRGGGEDAETEDVHEIAAVRQTAVHPLDAPRGDLTRRRQRVVRHAQRPREIVGRTHRYDPDPHVEPLGLHAVHHEIHRAVAARGHQQVDLLASVERIDREVDGHRLHAVAVLAEYAAYLLRGRSGAAPAGFFVI